MILQLTRLASSMCSTCTMSGLITADRVFHGFDEARVAMQADAIGECGHPALRVGIPLHEMNRVKIVEMGEAANIVQARFVGHENDVEVGTEGAHQLRHAARAAMTRREQRKRRDQHHAAAFAVLGLRPAQAIAERGLQHGRLPAGTRERWRQRIQRRLPGSQTLAKHSGSLRQACNVALGLIRHRTDAVHDPLRSMLRDRLSRIEQQAIALHDALDLFFEVEARGGCAMPVSDT